MPKYHTEFTDKLLQNKYESLRGQGFNKKEAVQLTIAEDNEQEAERIIKYERIGV